MLRAAGRRRCARRRAPLGIPHYVVDEADQFERRRDRLFLQRIPGRPDTESVCDVQRETQIRQSLEKARALGCDYIATGHYAIIEHRAGRDRRRVDVKVSIRGRTNHIFFSVCASRNCTARSRRSVECQNRRFARLHSSLGLKVADKR